MKAILMGIAFDSIWSSRPYDIVPLFTIDIPDLPFMVIRLLLPVFFLATWLTFIPTDAKPTKRALVITIGEYNPERTGWRRINSANDARVLEPVLLQQGFIVKIVSDPTRAEIVSALNSLREQAKPGDIVLVHISSHGVGITDDNGDEIDGLDECIVPIDAPDLSKLPVGYKGEKHLRDDQLGELLTSIRERLGPQGDLLVLLDACHSGTGTRGPGGVVRGSTEPLRLPDFPTKPGLVEDPTVFFELPSGPALSDITVLAAAQANHLNYENATQQCGSLTSAFCSVISETSSNMTYQALFDRVQSKISLIDVCYQSGQRAELESTQPNRLLFGGQKAEPKQAFPILSLNPTEHTALINGGKLAGMDVGTRLKLYKAGDNPLTAKALDSAVVESADALQAEVKFAGKLLIKRPQEGLFYVGQRIFRDDTLFINSSSLPPALLSPLRQSIAKLAYLVVFRTTGFDVEASPKKVAAGDAVQFTLARSGLPYPEMTADPARLASILEQLYWAKTLRRVTLNQEDIDVRWSFERKPNPPADTTVYLRVWKGELQVRVVKSGYYLRLQNRGKETIWFNILDFQPDGVYSVLVPQAKTQEEGYRLEPGQVKEVDFGVNKPFGNEVFKLFTATAPLNLRPLVGGQARGLARDDPPLTRFIKTRLSTRGATYPEDTKEGKTLEIHYVITP